MRLCFYDVPTSRAQELLAEVREHDRDASLHTTPDPDVTSLAFEAPTSVHRAFERTAGVVLTEDLS